MATYTLKHLAQLLDAQWLGDGDLEVTQVVHPVHARQASDLALILDPSILEKLHAVPLSTALVPAQVDVPQIPNQLKVSRPKVALAKLLSLFEKPVYILPGIHPSAVIDPSATIGQNVTIGPLCSIGPNTVLGDNTRLVSNVYVGADVVLGEACLIHAGVSLGDRVRLGNRVVVQPNATVGNDGYSYVTPEAGSVESARATGEIQSQNTGIIRINSVGTVVLEDDVEIGANACIDRATLGETRIGRGTKIDNLVQVAHNVDIGENCLIVSQVGIAGSSRIGDRTVIAGQAGIPDHINIGADCIIMPQAGVTSDIPAKSIYVGSPAVPRREFLTKEMNIKRVKGLSQTVKSLTERVDALSAQPQVEPV